VGDVEDSPAARAVNAYDGDDSVIVAFMDNDMAWQTRRITHDQAVQLADQLRLLTRSSD
jgi:hypothetical protein